MSDKDEHISNIDSLSRAYKYDIDFDKLAKDEFNKLKKRSLLQPSDNISRCDIATLITDALLVKVDSIAEEFTSHEQGYLRQDIENIFHERLFSYLTMHPTLCNPFYRYQEGVEFDI